MAHQILCLATLLGAVACLALPTENSRSQRQLYTYDFPYAPPLHPQRYVAPPPLQDPLYYPVAGAYNVVPSLKQFQYQPHVQYGVLPPAPVASPIRYAPALVASNGQQQVIFTPPGPNAFLPSNVVVYRPNPKDETGNSEESYVQSFLNFVSHFVSSQQPEVEKPSGEESPAAEAEKPEKVQAAQTGSSAEKEDKKDEKKGVKKEDKENEKKENSVVVDRPAPQRFVVVGEPQFFGRFAGIPQTLRQPQVPSVNKGAVSSYLLFRNFGPAPGEIEQDNEYPQSAPEYDFDVTQDAPGRAALSYQKFLAQANQREVDDSASVVVEAASKDASEDNAQQAEASSENSESEKVDAEEETGPTIAQVKPSAIALAGPGGVAAASPIGTALVGPGGMALSSPSATAVAGPSGAVPGGIAVSPSVNKALKTYNLANKNFASFINQ